MKKSRVGFTIVELLVVIVVIAILATITVVAYTGIQEQARDSKRKQDVASIAKLISMYESEHGPMRTNGQGCGGQIGTSRGWFNYGGTTAYPRSVMQCLIDANLTTTEIRDNSITCSNNTDCRAYMAYACLDNTTGREVVYVYANLETISPADANTSGTCASNIAGTFGMDYYVRVN